MADIVGTTVASRRWPAGGKPMVGRRWPADGGPTSASNGNVPPASHRLTDGGPLVAICRYSHWRTDGVVLSGVMVFLSRCPSIGGTPIVAGRPQLWRYREVGVVDGARCCIGMCPVL